jgi:hypothetical protein
MPQRDKGRAAAERTFSAQTDTRAGNRALDAEQAAQIIRGHWSIENGLHWFQDLCFGEDSCRGKSQCDEKSGTVPPAKNRRTRKTIQHYAALKGKCSGLPSATIFFTTHCSAHLNDVALAAGRLFLTRNSKCDYLFLGRIF